MGKATPSTADPAAALVIDGRWTVVLQYPRRTGLPFVPECHGWPCGDGTKVSTHPVRCALAEHLKQARPSRCSGKGGGEGGFISQTGELRPEEVFWNGNGDESREPRSWHSIPCKTSRSDLPGLRPSPLRERRPGYRYPSSLRSGRHGVPCSWGVRAFK